MRVRHRLRVLDGLHSGRAAGCQRQHRISADGLAFQCTVLLARGEGRLEHPWGAAERLLARLGTDWRGMV